MKRILVALLAAALLMTAAVSCDTTSDDGETTTAGESVTTNGSAVTEEPTDTEESTTDEAATGDATTEESTTEAATTPDEPADLAYSSAVEVLSLVWNAFPADQKFFVMGGDYTNMVMDAPGAFDLTAEGAADSLRGMTWYPVADFAKIDDAATLLHAMMTNFFTCSAYHFTNEADAAAMVNTMKDILLNAKYDCGQPEKVAIVSVPGNYLIVMFGLGEGCVDLFASTAVSTIEGATIVVDEMIFN